MISDAEAIYMESHPSRLFAILPSVLDVLLTVAILVCAHFELVAVRWLEAGNSSIRIGQFLFPLLWADCAVAVLNFVLIRPIVNCYNSHSVDYIITDKRIFDGATTVMLTAETEVRTKTSAIQRLFNRGDVIVNEEAFLVNVSDPQGVASTISSLTAELCSS